MAAVVAKARPRLDLQVARQVAQKLLVADLGTHGIQMIGASPVLLLGVRGYYADSLGRPRENDYGIFDDAIFVCRPDGTGAAFNANVDPARAGWNPGVDKFFAMLTEGVYVFRQGTHHGSAGDVKNALRQLTPAEAAARNLDLYFPAGDPRAEGKFRVRRVERDQGIPEGEIEYGTQNINVHPGSKNGTSSWGCQTLPIAQWPEFSQAVYDSMSDAGQGDLIAYVLCSRGYSL